MSDRSSKDQAPHRSIEDPSKLRRVIEATMLLEANLDLPTLLHHIVEEARSMTNARYGALGVLDDEGTALAEFITVGLSIDEVERIGAPPTGQGVLGLLIVDPKPIRLANLSSHPESYGFPANHPRMESFLGVPIRVRDRSYGNLYLTEKIGWSEFTRDDQTLVAALAIAAGFAIENARLHQRAQEVAVYEERDRLARDLHDTVIQRLFAVGLSLQSMASTPSAEGIVDRLDAAIRDIDDTIRQVRTTIFGLGSAGIGRGIRATVLSLVREVTPVVGSEIEVSFNGPVDSVIPDRVAEHLLATVREALTNVGRHADATEVRLALTVEDGTCSLEVVDNGRGIGDNPSSEGGLGLVNLRSRAEKLHGRFTVESPAGGGTVLTWQVPIDR
ncbi:MAG TPA: GAF domain-containing sensor histidine kinase [Acidimicrobiales bacterium]|nr:GAF domain-containing sensor histidine kinase [Acidimicrobiales bacterium]